MLQQLILDYPPAISGFKQFIKKHPQLITRKFEEPDIMGPNYKR